MSSNESYNTIVIGAGQAGLAAGYYLSQKGDDFVIVDQNSQIGETWRKRWDSLRLFTPSFYNHLPGMKFPKPDFYFPTKDETADYLEAYARQFNLPVRLGVKVDGLQRNEAGYQLLTGETSYHARNIIVATGSFHTPHVPYFAGKFALGIQQVHSVNYRKPSDVPGKSVLVAGAGNSGAEIAIELAKAGKKVWLAGRDVGKPPAALLRRIIGDKSYWWFLSHAMTIDNPLGRRLRTRVLTHGGPLIRTQREDVAQAGVELLPRLVDSQDAIPHTADGKVIAADGIVWATGFKENYQWIKLPVFDNEGHLQHERGVVAQAPGLFFIGLPFQTGLTSVLLGGVGEDARYIAQQVS